MNDRFKVLTPCSSTLKSWFVNMSVASFAVGVYQRDYSGILLGAVTFCLAIAIDYVIEEQKK